MVSELKVDTDPAEVGLDPDRRCVILASGREIPYDAALIATGSSPRPAGVTGPMLW